MLKKKEFGLRVCEGVLDSFLFRLSVQGRDVLLGLFDDNELIKGSLFVAPASISCLLEFSFF